MSSSSYEKANENENENENEDEDEDENENEGLLLVTRRNLPLRLLRL